MSERLLTVEEVAQQLQLKAVTVRSGGAGTISIPRILLGRLIRYRQADVDAFIEKRRRGPMAIAAQPKARRAG